MSKIVRVQDSDYKLIVGSENSFGNILLDTNPLGELAGQGTVTITGNLTVLGNTNVIESETLTIKDNIIFINEGETGSGVSTLGTTSGIEINRGSLPNASILWDEILQSMNPDTVLEENGTFVFSDVSADPDFPGKSKLRAIATNSINTYGKNLALISSGDGVITVQGTSDYEEQVLNYTKLRQDFLTITEVSRSSNVATIKVASPHGLITGDRIFVRCDTFTLYNTEFDTPLPVTVIDTTTFTYQNIAPNQFATTLVTGIVIPYPVINDDYIPNIKAVSDYANSLFKNVSESIIINQLRDLDTLVTVKDFDSVGVSEIVFTVDNVEQAKINNSGLTVDNININNNNIVNTNISDNILIDSNLSLIFKNTDPAFTPGYVTLYTKSDPGTGGTGIFFVNPARTDDELISKTKSILFSLIL